MRASGIRSALNIAGWLLILMGTIWVLQGVNLLPGSFMSGQTKWAVNGAAAVIAGAIVLIVNRRKRRAP